MPPPEGPSPAELARRAALRAASPLTPRVDLLAELQRARVLQLRARNALSNAAQALLRRMIASLGAADAARTKTEARRIWKALLDGEPIPEWETLVAALAADLGAFRAQVEIGQTRIDEIEKTMIRVARELPAHAWQKTVRGFGDKALAVIVAEAGDLSLYPHPRMLWKRLGLMPWNGRAISRWSAKDLTADEWKQVGYAGRRRAEIFAFVDEPLSKMQLRSAAKSGSEFGSPLGPYGEVYVRRRERNKRERPDWPPAHARRDALRIMTKQLVSDLWSEWRGRHVMQLKAIGDFADPADAPLAPAEQESP